jgi:hypothetical protein
MGCVLLAPRSALGLNALYRCQSPVVNRKCTSCAKSVTVRRICRRFVQIDRQSLHFEHVHKNTGTALHLDLGQPALRSRVPFGANPRQEPADNFDRISSPFTLITRKCSGFWRALDDGRTRCSIVSFLCDSIGQILAQIGLARVRIRRRTAAARHDLIDTMRPSESRYRLTPNARRDGRTCSSSARRHRTRFTIEILPPCERVTLERAKPDILSDRTPIPTNVRLLSKWRICGVQELRWLSFLRRPIANKARPSLLPAPCYPS